MESSQDTFPEIPRKKLWTSNTCRKKLKVSYREIERGREKSKVRVERERKSSLEFHTRLSDK